MSKQKYVIDKTLDAMLQVAVSDSEDKMVDDLLKGFEGESHEFSEKHINDMQILFKKEQRSQFYRRIQTYSKRAAVIFIAVILISAISISSVSAWRIKFMNFIIEMTRYDTDINFDDNDSKTDTYKFEEITLEYIPEGFKLERSEVRENHLNLTFEKNQEFFNFRTRDIGGSLSIDTENADVKKLMINGSYALYSENNNNSILVWHDDETAYILTGNISQNELIKIAEKINK